MYVEILNDCELWPHKDYETRPSYLPKVARKYHPVETGDSYALTTQYCAVFPYRASQD